MALLLPSHLPRCMGECYPNIADSKYTIVGAQEGGEEQAVKCDRCGQRYLLLGTTLAAVFLWPKRTPRDDSYTRRLNGWIIQVLDPYYRHHSRLWLASEKIRQRGIMAHAILTLGIPRQETMEKSLEGLTPQDQQAFSNLCSRLDATNPPMPFPALYPPMFPDVFDGWYLDPSGPELTWHRIHHSISNKVVVPIEMSVWDDEGVVHWALANV